MSLRTALILAVAPLALLGLAVGAGPAAAAPDNGNTFPLDLSCSNGQDYSVTLVEHADDAAAAHLATGGSVLVPTAFQFHITLTDSTGAVIDEITPPRELVHGASGTQLDTVSCTFVQQETEEIPGHGVVTIVVEGTVDAFVPR